MGEVRMGIPGLKPDLAMSEEYGLKELVIRFGGGNVAEQWRIEHAHGKTRVFRGETDVSYCVTRIEFKHEVGSEPYVEMACLTHRAVEKSIEE